MSSHNVLINENSSINNINLHVSSSLDEIENRELFNHALFGIRPRSILLKPKNAKFDDSSSYTGMQLT